jgi:hypothetical protein
MRPVSPLWCYDPLPDPRECRYDGPDTGPEPSILLIRRTILAFFVLSMALNAALMLPRFGWWCVPALFAGWYAADCVSGLVHLVLDYHPCPTGRGIHEIYFYAGNRESAEYQAMRKACMAQLSLFERITFDFKTHHPRPEALGRRSFWAQIGSTLIIGALPASLALNAAALAGYAPGWLIAFGLTLITGSALAQYFHGTLHREPPPRHIRVLRRLGLLMTPAAHQFHHDSLQRDFATNCGWSNPLVNRLFVALRGRGMLDDAGLTPQG